MMTLPILKAIVADESRPREERLEAARRVNSAEVDEMTIEEARAIRDELAERWCEADGLQAEILYDRLALVEVTIAEFSLDMNGTETKQ